MKNKFAYILFLILLYLWIFSPAFWIFRGRFVISNVIAFVGILSFLVNPKIIGSFIGTFRTEFRWLLYFFVLSVFLIVLDFQTSMATQHLIMMVDTFCVMPMLFHYAQKNGFGSEKYIVRSLLVISVVATFFTLLCLTFPSFNDYIKFSVIKYDTDSFLFNTDYRGFGFANGLTGDYGFILGSLVALGGFYIKDNKWFYFFIPLIAISILVNARTGIIIAMAGLACLFLQKRSIVGTLVIAALAIFFASNFEGILARLNINDATINWIATFQDEVTNVATERDVRYSGTIETLFGGMIVFPEDFSQWLIGRGYELFGNVHGVRHSDVGWINQLNYGGLIYFVPLVFFFYKIVRSLIKNKGLGFGLFILFAILISNTKGRLFPSYSLFTIIMMVYFVSSPKFLGNSRI